MHVFAGLNLASVTFLSPDMDYGEFMGRCGPRLRSVCSLVTVYGDVNDTALDLSTNVNKFWYHMWPYVAPPGLREETCAPLNASCSILIRLKHEQERY